MKTEEFKLSDFSYIWGGGTFEIEIVQSDSYSVNVIADDGLFKNLSVSQEGETLRLRRSSHISWSLNRSRPKARITMPLLKGLKLAGASLAIINGFSSSEDFELDLSGASEARGDITAGNAEFKLSGASRLKLSGSARDAIINASGASQVDLGGFLVQNAAVRFSGASRGTVHAEGTLDIKLSGASNLTWVGNPVFGDITTSGASHLSHE